MSIQETIITMIKEYIVSELPDRLDYEEKNNEDRLSLPMFENIYYGDHELSSLDSWPVLMFRYGPLEIEEQTTQQDLYTFNITLWIVVSDSSYENMQKTLFRYTDSMKYIFDIDRTLSDIAEESRITAISYSPVMSPSQAMQIGFVDAEIQVLVNRR